MRAGIEGTNSEPKRTYGLGRLHMRGEARLWLAVYLKALACNVERMVHALQAWERQEAQAGEALAAVPA